MKYLKVKSNLNTVHKTFFYVQLAKSLVALFVCLFFITFIKETKFNFYVDNLSFAYFFISFSSLLIFNVLNKETRKYVPFIVGAIEVLMACYYIREANFYFNTLYFWGFAIIASNYFFTNIKFTSITTLVYALFAIGNMYFMQGDNVVFDLSKEYIPSFALSLGSFAIYNFLIYMLIEKYRIGYSQEMEKLSQYNRSLIDAIPGFVSWVNADLEYLGVNKQMCEFFRKDESYFIGTRIGELTGHEQSRLKNMVKKFLSGNKTEKQDKLTYIFNGQTYHNILSLVKYGSGVLIVTFDVTKIIEAEDLINIERERAQTSARLASFGEVSAGIAHEINNPLAVISAINYKLKRLKSKDQLSDDFLDEFNEKVDKQITLISKIVKSIKTLSRDGHSDPFETKNISELIDEVKILVEPKCKGKYIDIQFPEHTEDYFLDCQGVQIGQVLIILLNNAVDAIKDLDEKWIKFSISNYSNGYEFVIEDSGSGIPKDVADNIFMPFFTTKSVGEGTGLGLSLAVKIIKLHGGEIRIDHTSDHTKFVIYLPKEQMKLAS